MIAMMKRQEEHLELQREEKRRQEERFLLQREEECRQREEEQQRQEERFSALLEKVTASSSTSTTPATVVASAPPTFSPFDSTSELWTDYYARFKTFLGAHSTPPEKRPQVFLTNQTATVYKLLSNLAAQAQPTKNINDLTMDEIVNFMQDQYDPKKFVIRERFKFWSDMQRRPGETIQELAARIRQDAATCDFPSIQDPQDEALRQRFICSVNNEAVLKALFKVKDNELTFAKAINIAIETEDAAKVAKETVHGTKPKPVNKVKQQSSKSTRKESSNQRTSVKCFRCGKGNHKAPDCRHKDATCNYCNIKGHLESVCRKKQKAANTKSNEPQTDCKRIDVVKAVPAHQDNLSKLEVPVEIQGQRCLMEIDTATTGNFITNSYWKKLGKPSLQPATSRYESASKHDLPVKGTFMGKTRVPGMQEQHDVCFTVTDVPDLNLLVRIATKQMGISVGKVLHSTQACHAVFDHLKPDVKLRNDCMTLCKEFQDLWKPELGCLKDFELEVEFKKEAQPIFCKARPVPRALQEDLEKQYEEGIAKGIWERAEFNEYGTPVVPVKKTSLPGQKKPQIRVCGDYSVTVNKQLKDHRHPLLLPEDL